MTTPAQNTAAMPVDVPQQETTAKTDTASQVKPADVVIVGAGPVGLWVAIQIKKRNPEMAVQIYERHKVYQRSHVLRLNLASLGFYSKKKSDEIETEFYQDVTGKSAAGVWMGALRAKAAVLGTNVLEGALKKYAQALGVNIAYEKIETPEDAIARHPECKKFVAADGAKSPLRKKLLGDNDVKQNYLQHVVEVKYTANKDAKGLSLLDRFKTHKLMSDETISFEILGSRKKVEGEDADSRRITVHFYTSEDLWKRVPDDAGFKTPLKLNDPRLPPELVADIQTYLNVRASKAKEDFNVASAKVSKLSISYYTARKFSVKHESGARWFFAGDAALGVPFFRALNSGIIIGSQLGYILTRDWLPDSVKSGFYNLARPFDRGWEYTEAQIKNSAITLYNAFRKVNGRSPLQVVKWSKAEAEAFKNDKHKAFDRA